MKRYKVKGMTCAACVSRVEKAVSKVPGVESCSVSLLTESMNVDGDVSDADVVRAVEKAGYRAVSAEPAGPAGSVGSAGFAGPVGSVGFSGKSPARDMLSESDVPLLVRRLAASVAFLLVLMYFSMGTMMLGWPLPAFLEHDHVAVAMLQMLLCIAVMVINGRFFVSGTRAALHLSPNMDTLVAMGSAASFLYSVWAVFAMSGAVAESGPDAAMKYMDELYFETAAMILTLITVGKLLEAVSKGRTTDAIKALVRLAPMEAVVERDGKELVVPVSSVMVGDVFLVRPGERVPVDGAVLDGGGAVDESALTGESIPVDKMPGDQVFAGTVNSSGFLRCKAGRVGEDTTLSRIIRMVGDAAATKAPIAKLADRLSAVFVPSVIGIAVVVLIAWLVAGESVGSALSFAIAVLVISCPCALGLATPVAIMVGSGVGARNGVLFKTAASLEQAGRIDIAVLDKTGTITSGRPVVTDVVTMPPGSGKSDDASRAGLLRLACSIEKKSEHPLARAVVRKAEEEGVTADEVHDFRAFPGGGVSAVSGGVRLAGGNRAFISSLAEVPAEAVEISDRLSLEGKTPLFFCRGSRLEGIVAVSDSLREDGARAVSELRAMGVRVVMLTGDNERTARAVGRQAGVDEVVASVLPDGKAEVVRVLRSQGKVAMVGDGINDAPALVEADLGVAIREGTDVAIDAADVILVKNRLSDVPAAIRLGRKTLKNIKENLFWAFFYNAAGIPLAAGLFFGLLGWRLNPVFGAAAMSLSSFCVVVNALRLNLFRPYGKNRQKDNKIMKKKLRIEGMMCAHCEMHVRKALEAVAGVSGAEVSLADGSAVVTLASDVSDDALRAAVEASGYKVTGVD